MLGFTSILVLLSVRQGGCMGNKLFGIINRRTLDIPERATTRILGDAYLNFLYSSELKIIMESITAQSPSKKLEIGGAGGNTKALYPDVITTDVRASEGIDMVMSAEVLPFADNSIDVIFGLDAFHHIRDPESHLFEAIRVLKPGGNCIYIEPNWNVFSMLCFKYLLKYLHPEPYDTRKKSWVLSDPDPMMGNQCQAFNIFVRDHALFSEKFPKFKVEFLEPLKGLAFLFSGGVHTRLPIPGRLLVKLAQIENRHSRWIKSVGLGRVIRLTKV